MTQIWIPKDESKFVSGGHDGTIKIWNMSTGNELFSFIAYKGPVRRNLTKKNLKLAEIFLQRHIKMLIILGKFVLRQR